MVYLEEALISFQVHPITRLLFVLLGFIWIKMDYVKMYLNWQWIGSCVTRTFNGDEDLFIEDLIKLVMDV